MLDNHVYNLVCQLAQEHKSLWRIKQQYKEDSGSCDDCAAFWEDMQKDKEQHIERILNLLKDHFKEE